MLHSNEMHEQSPEDQANFLSWLFYSWLNNLVWLANQRPLVEEDLFPLSDKNKAQEIVENFEDLWEEETIRAERQGKTPRLWKAMARFISGRQYFTLIIFRIIQCFSMFAAVGFLWIYLKLLLEKPQGNVSSLVGAVGGIGVASILKAFTFHYNNHHALVIGMRLRIACVGILYNKILASSRSSVSRVTVGHVINMVSNDAKRIDNIISNLSMMLSLVIDIPIAIALLCTLVGCWSVSSIGIIVLFFFFQLYLTKQFSKIRIKQASVTDKRLTTLKDIIIGIRTVKMYAWEWNYREMIKLSRRNEIYLIRLKNLILAFSHSLYLILPVVAILTSVLAMIYTGAHLDAVDIFTIVLILGNTSDSTYRQIFGARGVYDGLVSVNRIENYLLIDYQSIETNADAKVNSSTVPGSNKLQKGSNQKPKQFKDTRNGSSIKYSLLRNINEPRTSTQKHDHNYPCVTLNHVSCGWYEHSNQTTLHDICLNIEPNKLVMITGRVGSGKSTLLMSILREIPLKSGSIITQGNIAYVSQIPWVFTGSVRENIIFGKEFEEKRYQRVLKVCDLQKDMDRLPKGDLSMIGQRGVSLSGGQRARVSLARAIYLDADIYLLDDPLSAVDAKVGQHIFDMCICGELSGRIRVLVTHQLQHLHRADDIVVLQEGRIVNRGSYEELSTNPSTISEILANYKTTDNKSVDSKQYSTLTVKNDEADSCTGRDVMEEVEDRTDGNVSWGLYWYYLRSGLPSVLIVVLILYYIVTCAVLVLPNVWLAFMASMSHSKQSNNLNLGVYGAVAGTSVFLQAIGILCLFMAFVKSSEKLHDKMTMSVIRSPVLFFDTNPVGRIMNRFSKDVGTIDDLLPLEFAITITASFSVFFAVLLIGIVNAWLFIVIVPMAITFIMICRCYLKPSNDLSRMESIRCSPLYAHFTETITGLEVIHSAGTEELSRKDFYHIQDFHTKAFYLVLSTSCWVGLYLDLLCSMFITAVAIGTLFLSMDPALTGLVLTYAISLLWVASISIRRGSDLENRMVSVERVKTYTHLPSEPGYERTAQPAEDWPHQGAVSVRGVSMVYLEGGPSVLKDISFDVQPKEKVGIAGRTGAGKSSLVAALFRMPDPQGQVLIDGVDLGTINIQTARRSMAVITQEPVLFAGSLKKNLDPLDIFTSDKVWTALKEVQLEDRINKLDGRLEYSIGEGGTGFSVGEQQLLCLARALLQRCKILVLDEATAYVDYKTDQLIQQVISQKFANCTVLTIAHRLNTIMDYDRVLVFDRGHVVQHDSPTALAAKRDGVFASLLKGHSS